MYRPRYQTIWKSNNALVIEGNEFTYRSVVRTFYFRGNVYSLPANNRNEKYRDKGPRSTKLIRGGTDFRQKGSAIYRPNWTPWQERTLTVGGACESVQNQFRSFPFRHRRRVYVFAFTSLSRGQRGRATKRNPYYLLFLFLFLFCFFFFHVTEGNIYKALGQTKKHGEKKSGGCWWPGEFHSMALRSRDHLFNPGLETVHLRES